MISYKEKLNVITTIMLDVDGVLTNGEVILFDNKVVRALNTKDGYAIQYAVKKGIRFFILTGGNCSDVKNRLENLGVTEVYLKSHTKLLDYEACKNKYGIEDHEVLFMGDDIPDIPVLKKVGLSSCPQDAAVDVKSICDYQSLFDGGKGCVRDIVEQVLRAQGKWLNDEAYKW